MSPVEIVVVAWGTLYNRILNSKAYAKVVIPVRFT